MSLILDALRKAEESRQGQAQPVLAVPAPMPVERSLVQYLPWLLGMAGALVLAAGVAVFVRGTDDSVTPLSQPAPPVAERETSPPTENREGVRVLSSEVRSGRTASPAAPPATSQQPAPAAAPRPGSVEVRDLLAEQAGITTTRPARPEPGTVTVQEPAARDDGAPNAAESIVAGHDSAAVKPGTVQVADLLGADAPEAAPASAAPPTATSDAPLRGVVDLRASSGNDTRAAATPAAVPPAATRVAPPEPPMPPPRETQPPVNTLPTMAQLVAEGLLVPPDVRLDMLVYRDNPASRIAFINMRRYRIGEKTPEGAVIEDITPAGAHLFYNGRRFLLQPR